MSTATPTTKDRKYLRWTEQGAKLFSTCSKAQYMAVIVNKVGTVVSTGYNGSPPGWAHCTDGACPRTTTTTQGGSYLNCIAVHAEANALIRAQAAECRGATVYVNGLPCWDCAKLIVGAGVARVVCRGGRRPVDEEQVLGFFATSATELVIVPAET